MSARMFKATIAVLAGTVLVAPATYADPPEQESGAVVTGSGSIVGLVSDISGIPQMGATVLLYNRFDRQLQRTLTNEKGTFGFDSLPPDTYTVRITLASFLPALKRNIVVQPGMQSLLSVNLAHVFSSIQLVAMTPGQNSIMSDEWKWVLRSSTTTRPVLRLVPELELEVSRPASRVAESAFSETRGLLRLSAGDHGHVSSLGSEPDLGTAFALATSFLGNNELQFSGNIGYSPYSGAPAAGFRTSFRRDHPGGLGPEVKLTMRQLFLPTRVGAGSIGAPGDSSPMLRTMSATYLDRSQLSESVRFDYGFALESVTFLDRLNHFSPYGRISYDRGPDEVIQFSYASGTPPAELFAGEGETEFELQQDLAALALFPRVSLRSGGARVQRSDTWEIGYRKTVGSRTYSAAFYNETVSNAALTIAGLGGIQPGSELVPDLFSDTWIFNGGDFHAMGYIASMTQSLAPRLDVTVAYGSGGALTADEQQFSLGTPDDLRAAIRSSRRHSVTTRVAGAMPQSGTQFVASYQWASLPSLTPAHMYMTQRMREGLGLNLRIRQPIPYLSALPGQFEATADLRNLLEQGYIPLTAGDRNVILMQNPRTVRGGLSFIF